MLESIYKHITDVVVIVHTTVYNPEHSVVLYIRPHFVLMRCIVAFTLGRSKDRVSVFHKLARPDSDNSN